MPNMRVLTEDVIRAGHALEQIERFRFCTYGQDSSFIIASIRSGVESAPGAVN